jgi:hypothetical protein
VKAMLDRLHREGKLDVVLSWSTTQFVNTMSQKPTVAQLLPAERCRTPTTAEHWRLHLRAEPRQRCSTACCRATSRSQVYRGAARERRLRTWRAHGGDGSATRQRRRADRRADARSTTRRARRRSPRN